MIKLAGSPKILLILTLSLALVGCGKNINDTAEILESVKIQESQTDQEYPKIIFIKNASYYGTEEKCEVVPRKSPDGVIETFVDAQIMPDVDGYANFGADQGKLEYMFVEDGRLIVHIGDDWYYFEKQGENVAIENPWTESDEKGVLEATGYNVKAPEDATEVHYSFCADEKMAQVTYQKDNIDWTYRIKESTEAEDISGMNYEWNVSEEGTVAGKKALYLAYSDAKENSETIDGTNYVQVVNWYDDVSGVSYSLSASGKDLNGIDIQVYAEQIYEPLQKETTDVSHKTYETETFDGTVIKIDETNIISQEKVEDVLETTLVPSDAEVIAPGRDFVYLADADNYYVEDTVDQLLTIAKKNETAENQTAQDDTAEYSTDEYSLSYRKTSFDTFEDADNKSVTFSYCKDGVETAGSNVITFTIVKDAKPKELLEEKVEAMGGKKSDVMEVSLTATSETCYTYIQSGSSTESELKTSQMLYAIPCGNDVIYVDGFRTIGPDEGVELSIDPDFEQIMQTLVVKK